MRIAESAEDYLEAILMISQEKGRVRGVDIANLRNVSKASVSVAMKNFCDKGLVTMDEERCVALTEKGMAIATRIYDRHNTIAQFWMQFGVPEEIAKADACKMEHDISEETYEVIKENVKH